MGMHGVAAVVLFTALLVSASGALGAETKGTHEGPLTVSENLTIRGDYVVEGALIVKGKAVLEVDYTGRSNGKFIVQGDVTVEDDATLWVHGAPDAKGNSFTIANDYNMHITLESRGSGVIRLEHMEFRTQTGDATAGGSRFMKYNAKDKSQMIVDGAYLDGLTAWLLGNFSEHAALKSNNAKGIPTETYIHDAARIEITGPTTEAMLWMPMTAGVSGTIDLPDQNGPYSWEASREKGLNVDWVLKINNAKSGLGIQSFPGSKIIVNGRGGPPPSELCIGYFADEGTEMISGLKVGLQNVTMGGRLTLNNVLLAPYGWLIHVTNNDMLTIEKSTVNEVDIVGTGHVTIKDCILQLAVLAALGKGSTMDVQDSEVWNQAIEADEDAHITLLNCAVHGSLLNARKPESVITIKGGSFHDNPEGCTPGNAMDVATGKPHCNPCRPAGPPKAMGLGTVKCEGTEGCSF